MLKLRKITKKSNDYFQQIAQLQLILQAMTCLNIQKIDEINR